MDSVFSADATAAWLSRFGVWAVLLSTLLSVVISIAGVIPSVFLSGANAVVFGLPLGFAISMIGEVTGAYVSYRLYGKGIMKWKKKQGMKGRWSRAFTNASPIRQFWLLLAARMAPFLPSGGVTLLAVWTQMRTVPFMLATVIGKAPSVAAEVWVGQGIFEVLWNWM
ncbi:TVP38/TMEM64 family protein [Paenibacillus gansuensis]|uniref:TVP38/TMEM64 family membrane protein n=1 Tax=Paenibacillus gansuensis TaxID=306542 RepID=A0ABW5PJV6_9BACL